MMEIVPMRAAPPPRTAPPPRGGLRAAVKKSPALGPAHTPPAHAESPPTAQDVALLEQQAAFNAMMQIRAELQREANALRDMAMEQVKRDDSVMNQWIKLI